MTIQQQKTQIAPEIQTILDKHNRGINIDLGCGQDKQKGFVGIDREPYDGVDIVWDLQKFPYPLPDECATVVMASHILEHLNPSSGDPRVENLVQLLLDKKVITPAEVQQYIGEYKFSSTIFMRFMDEVWRLLKPDGQFMIVSPYSGSLGYWQDPTHINGFNELTFAYFDPLEPTIGSALYRQYHPKPWKVEYSTWAQNGNIEVCLQKRREDKSYDK
jgi:SAM-dependent methyltransferase